MDVSLFLWRWVLLGFIMMQIFKQVPKHPRLIPMETRKRILCRYFRDILTQHFFVSFILFFSYSKYLRMPLIKLDHSLWVIAFGLLMVWPKKAP